MALGFTIAGPTSSSYAATCTYTGCSGKDPQSYGCSSGATTVREMSYLQVHLELRYSAKCHASWMRYTKTEIMYNTADNMVFDRYISAGNVGWVHQYSIYLWTGELSGWSKMIGSDATLRVGVWNSTNSSAVGGKTASYSAS
ncbi:DUF2690 domain-containing protein [Cellulomonas sp. JH27-2]|uniref:DUF2690 domain-containing protein n=1 Tax=Cellulomonas sp. JH27-2 TaxID=2774139 RepID=UPI001CD8F939